MGEIPGPAPQEHIKGESSLPEVPQNFQSLHEAARRRWLLNLPQPNQAEILDAARRTDSNGMYIGASSM